MRDHPAPVALPRFDEGQVKPGAAACPSSLAMIFEVSSSSLERRRHEGNTYPS